MNEKESKKSKQYINNEEFLLAMIEWKKKVSEAEDCGEKNPPVSSYIGECFMKISERLSFRPNFMNYPFREDMVGDGIENCILYAHNFDETKSKNPFSYFTQIIYYAFLRRIEKEKKQAYVKYKMMKMDEDATKYTQWIKDKDFEEYNNTYTTHLLSDNDIEKLEPQKKRKKRKKNFFDE